MKIKFFKHTIILAKKRKEKKATLFSHKFIITI